MKKLTIIAAAFSMLALNSCSKEEDPTPPQSTAEYNGTSYVLAKGGIVTDAAVNSEAYVKEFKLSDTAVTFENHTSQSLQGNILVEITFIDAGDATFDDGTYETPAGLIGVGSSYARVYLTIDNNEDGKIDSNDTRMSALPGGSVSIITTGENTYSLEFDASFDNSNTITGKYEGEVTYIETAVR